MESSPVQKSTGYELHHHRPSGPIVRMRVTFGRDRRGDPLKSFPQVSLGGQPYNRWLTERVLDPVLAGWAGSPDGERLPASQVARDIEGASERARAAFQEALPAAVAAGEPAVLAAMSVTANLQRTLATLGDFILTGTRPDRNFGLRLGLSPLWCGLITYGPQTPWFPAPICPPTHSSRLPGRRRDPRHLANALWCSMGDITRRCDEALALLQWEIRRRRDLFVPEDLHHL